MSISEIINLIPYHVILCQAHLQLVFKYQTSFVLLHLYPLLRGTCACVLSSTLMRKVFRRMLKLITEILTHLKKIDIIKNVIYIYFEEFITRLIGLASDWAWTWWLKLAANINFSEHRQWKRYVLAYYMYLFIFVN